MNWELLVGMIEGFLFGYRSYHQEEFTEHVLYIGVFDIVLVIYND
jgi:hypothetical protein